MIALSEPMQRDVPLVTVATVDPLPFTTATPPWAFTANSKAWSTKVAPNRKARRVAAAISRRKGGSK